MKLENMGKRFCLSEIWCDNGFCKNIGNENYLLNFEFLVGSIVGYLRYCIVKIL